MKRFCLVAAILVVVGGVGRADVLWYNGDFAGSSGLSNEINTLISAGRVYDDFNVPSGGWTINSIWSNDLMNFGGVTQAKWEIRSGVSAGNGGTLLFSGTDAAAQLPTGRSGFGFAEYTIEVDGLNLPLGPGTYWLMVAPIGPGSGRSLVSMTSGFNSVGSPAGNDDKSFFDSPYFGTVFDYPYIWTAFALISAPNDFSMGASGERGAVPEPCTFALFGFGALGLLRRRVRKSG
jgi:hypothetical protein